MKTLWAKYPIFKDAPYYRGGIPYYFQWLAWCWKKPLYIGLPLTPLSAPLLIFDVLYFLSRLLRYWGKDPFDE